MAPDPGADPGRAARRSGGCRAGACRRQRGKAGERQGAGERQAAGKRHFWRDLAVIVVAALALTILLKAFVVQVFSIPSGSMENTLLPGDRILVSKIVYNFRSIARGDIVGFGGAGSWDPPAQPPSNWFAGILGDATNLVGIAGPDTDYIKRVIGVPGDHVACCNAQGQVTVNGVPLSEKSYVYPGRRALRGAVRHHRPGGAAVVMGDNRGDSDDSRFRTNDPGGGTIPESAVVGRAFLIIWPLSRVSDLPIPNTFEQAGSAPPRRPRPRRPPPSQAGYRRRGRGGPHLAPPAQAGRRAPEGQGGRPTGRRLRPGDPCLRRGAIGCAEGTIRSL